MLWGKFSEFDSKFARLLETPEQSQLQKSKADIEKKDVD